MDGFLLDTNVLSEFARAQPADPRVDQWLRSVPNDMLFVSVLSIGEIRRGIELMPTGKRRAELEAWLAQLEQAFSSRLLPVTKAVANRWAVLSAQAQRRGTPLAIVDGFIAATALEYGLAVATRNVKDFTSLGGRIVNPWEA